MKRPRRRRNLAKKSKSKGRAADNFDEVAERLRREAAPILARALNLDRAEALEAAVNAAVEVGLAARALVRALPMPPESRAHLDRAEREALRAARLAVSGLNGRRKEGAPRGGARKVEVEFGSDRSETRR